MSEQNRGDNQNAMPFKGEWEPYFADKESLYSNSENEGKIIRKDWAPQRADGKGIDLDKTIQLYQLMKKSIETARSYGIKFPNYEVVFGKKDDSSRASAFLVIDRIEGEILDDIIEPTPELIQEIISYCKSVSDYIKNSFDQDSPWMTDIGLHQVMWGHKRGETQDHLYNVDIELTASVNKENRDYSKNPEDLKKQSVYRMKIDLRRLLRLLIEQEARLHANFQEAKDYILNTYKNITGKEPKGDLDYIPFGTDKFPEDE